MLQREKKNFVFVFCSFAARKAVDGVWRYKLTFMMYAYDHDVATALTPQTVADNLKNL